MADSFSGEKYPKYVPQEEIENQRRPPDLLSIGQIARLCRVSTKTLRHYDRIGIFKPEFLDPDTGYRYYKKNQLFWLVMIKRLKYRFFSLEEISKFFSSNTVSDTEKLFIEKENEIDEKIKELHTAKRLLHEKLQFFKTIDQVEKEGLINREDFIIKKIPSRNIIFIRSSDFFSIEKISEDLSKIQSLRENMKLEINGLGMAVFHSKYSNCINEKIDFEIASELASCDEKTGQNIRTIPEGNYACFFHKGSRESSVEMYEKIIHLFDKRGIRTCGPLLKIYLLGFAHTKSRENIVSEFQIKII